MHTYTFIGGVEIVKIKCEPLKDLVMASKSTAFKFVPLSKLLKGPQMELLQKTLGAVYDEYLIKEFNKMGYQLKEKKIEDGASS